jgi:hypothetical protein
LAQPIIKGYSRIFAAPGWNWIPPLGIYEDGRIVELCPTEWGDEMQAIMLFGG